MEVVRAELKNGLRCVCHVLHQAIGKGLAIEAIKGPLDRLRTVCSHGWLPMAKSTHGFAQIKNSCVLTEALFQEEKKENLPQLKVILDAKWRWGYSFAMLDRFFQVRQAVMNLTQYPSFEWVLYPEDVALLKEIRDVLQHIVSNLALLEGDNQGLQSSCQSWHQVSHLAHGHPDPVISQVRSVPSKAFRFTLGSAIPPSGRRLCGCPLSHLAYAQNSAVNIADFPIQSCGQENFGNHFRSPHCKKASTFLDPRFVQLTPFVPEYDREEWVKEVMKLVTELAEDTFVPETTADVVEIADVPVESSNPKKQKVENAFFEYMESSQSSTQTVKSQPTIRKESTRVRVQKELRLYAKTSQLGVRDDPLKWWWENEGVYPVLATVAKRVLAVPASSAQCWPIPKAPTLIDEINLANSGLPPLSESFPSSLVSMRPTVPA